MIVFNSGTNEPFKSARLLEEQRESDPLVGRRASVEDEFLIELTALTRKYGLVIKADVRMEYGDSYHDLSLETTCYGTEGHYVVGGFGIEWSASQNAPECTGELRLIFEDAKRLRAEENEAISSYHRELSRLHFAAWEIARNEEMERLLQKRGLDKTRPSFLCNCGKSFKTESRLRGHAKKTGHTTISARESLTD